MKKFLKKV